MKKLKRSLNYKFHAEIMVYLNKFILIKNLGKMGNKFQENNIKFADKSDELQKIRTMLKPNLNEALTNLDAQFLRPTHNLFLRGFARSFGDDIIN